MANWQQYASSCWFLSTSTPGPHPYSRQRAAYPLGKTSAKYWPPVRRIDPVWGDRNVICTCPGVEELAILQMEN